MTCDDLGTQAAQLSADHKADPLLIKVRAVKMTADHRENYVKPAGDGDATVLECAGTGVWSDLATSPVKLKLTVDKDGTSSSPTSRRRGP